MMPNGSLPALPSRHLGLVTADQANLSADSSRSIGRRLRPASRCVGDCRTGHGQLVRGLRSGRVCQIRKRLESPNPESPNRHGPPGHRPRRSLSFLLSRQPGSPRARPARSWSPFSPISDARLPADLDGLYFGGGYPEMHAARLAGNASMLADVRQFAASGRAIYAECGGLMYLGQSLAALDGVRHPLGRRAADRDGHARPSSSRWAMPRSRCRKIRSGGRAARRFAATSSTTPKSRNRFPADSGWQTVYSVQQRSGEPVKLEGFQKGRILASYVHGHFASHPRLIERFLANCGGRR